MIHEQIERASDQKSLIALMLGDDLASLMRRHRPRDGASELPVPLPLQVDRVRARFAAWYEMFPRSAGTDSWSRQHVSRRHSTACRQFTRWVSTCSTSRRSIQ